MFWMFHSNSMVWASTRPRQRNTGLLARRLPRPFQTRIALDLQNDITLNKVSRIEYRFGSTGNWTTAVSPNSYSANLDFRIPVPTDVTGTIQIRAIDSRVGVTSPIFSGNVRGIDSATSSVSVGLSIQISQIMAHGKRMNQVWKVGRFRLLMLRERLAIYSLESSQIRYQWGRFHQPRLPV